jgi:cupin superfamily acireductone dioxygenase involved in methionine salvage
MIQSKYIIFDRDGNYYEYNAENVFEAIDTYIMMDVNDFHITIETWSKIKVSCALTEERIALANELMDYSNEKIERIIANYDYLFGDEISPSENEK